MRGRWNGYLEGAADGPPRVTGKICLEAADCFRHGCTGACVPIGLSVAYSRQRGRGTTSVGEE